MRALVVVMTVVALGALVLGLFPPIDVVRVYLLAIVALAGVVVSRGTLSRFGRMERHAVQPESVDLEPPAFFDRALRRIELANSSGVYFEQLRPRLREIAEQRLAAQGLRLQSDEARALLGEEAWLALERRPRGDKFSPLREGELGRVIEALERV